MEKNPTGKTIRFERRDILRFMTRVPAAALLSTTPFAAEMAKAAPPQGQDREEPKVYTPKSFNPHEWRTIRILSDLIIPADEHSGSATQAGVPEFIDDWLNLKRGDSLTEIRGGLTWLDMESNRSSGYDFADCPAAGQKQILNRIAFPEKAAAEDAAAVAFFNRLRDLVVSGFFTSITGIRDLPYVGNEPQSEWSGCPTQALAKLGINEFKTSG